MRQPDRTDSIDAAVDAIVARCGPAIVAAAPLGLGKPVALLNALYRRVVADASLTLTLYTALSLTRPVPKAGLEARFAGPFLARHFEGVEDLDYAIDRRRGALCPRVRVHEFYFQSGALLGHDAAQRDYTSINYTHVAREVAARGPNLVLQQVARRGERISLSSNPDVTPDLIDRMAREGRARPYLVLVVNPELPFMAHDAELPLAAADLLVEPAAPGARLFALPREPVAPHEHALGHHASALVRDGGSLQIGIGALSDALVAALLRRHDDPAHWRATLLALRGDDAVPASLAAIGGEGRFERGLYGASEMVMDGFMHLRRAGILRRRVYDDLALQRALDGGVIGEVADRATLDRLIEHGIVTVPLDRPSVDRLVHFGWLPEGTRLHEGVLHLPGGAAFDAELRSAAARDALRAAMNGRRLRHGRWLHGAFFLGSKPFYDWLRGLEGEEAEGLAMTRVSHINELYGGREALDIVQRRHARFFNTCMLHTLLGAAVSDAVAGGRVVSGVGGQYNFVAMAHALPDGRSVLMLRASRESGGRAQSSLVFEYPHTTIPRHLRDLVVTEYGVAELRGEHDEAVVRAMLAVADARFLDDLVAGAKAAGKLARDFTVPDAWRAHTPEGLRDAWRRAGGAPPRFPFGDDFDDTERALLPALARLRAASATLRGRIDLLGKALRAPPATPADPRLARMGLAAPRGIGEHLLARILRAGLAEQGS